MFEYSQLIKTEQAIELKSMHRDLFKSLQKQEMKL